MDKPTELPCARCGSLNTGDAKTCRSCGNPLAVSGADRAGDAGAENSEDRTVMVFNRRRGPKRYRLVMIAEDGSPLETFAIEDGTVIGRTGGDIQLHDRHISRRHCAFTIQKGRLYLKDLNSTNGVFLRIRSPARIKTPAELMIGHTICRVVHKS
ncbi:MAG: FHA domain-containing protein [Methylococcaceae bacterium]|nr:FHA domain-containing protein [Methylococcaceae bacterium]